MNLARHAAVLWRFRVVAAAGLALAIILAVLASYSVSWDGGPTFTPRGTETWTANSSILVTQPGFPEGRVTLPQAQLDDSDPAPLDADGNRVEENEPKNQVEFADPGRLSSLADLYSKFLTSDEVVGPIPGEIKPDQVAASPFLASAGGQLLPVIQLTTTGASQQAAQSLNEGLFANLRALIEEQQRANGIGSGKRVELKILDAPEAALTGPRKRTAAILVFVLVALATLALTHLLAGLRPQERDLADQFVDWEIADVDAELDHDDVMDRDDPRIYDVSSRRRQ
jgi:hypothetical protein